MRNFVQPECEPKLRIRKLFFMKEQPKIIVTPFQMVIAPKIFRIGSNIKVVNN